MGARRTGLWRGCQSVVDRLDLPDPFDAESFIAALAHKRGRPIELIGVPARPDRPCGLLITTACSDLIIYSNDTGTVHRQHILLHEAAHLVRGHDSAGAASSTGLSVLLPHLAPSLIRSVLGRTVYSEPQEREAELIATMIHHRASRERSTAARWKTGQSGRNRQDGPDSQDSQGSPGSPDIPASQNLSDSQNRRPERQTGRSGRGSRNGRAEERSEAADQAGSPPPPDSQRPLIEAMFGIGRH